jgi:tetratricopeptide (TPR) repeat protein
MKSAEELLRQLFALPAVDAFWDAYKADWPRFLISRGRLDEALNASREMTQSRFPLGRTMGHVFAGRALAAASQLDEARQELKAAEQELQDVEEFNPEPLMPQPRAIPALYMELLRGEIALRMGQKAEAESKFKYVQSQMLARRSMADAVSLLFIIQQMAQEARENNAWDLADYTARQMLAFDPEYAGGHFAMALVAEHKGTPDKMRQEFEMAKKLWASADPNLAELKYMQQKLTVQK